MADIKFEAQSYAYFLINSGFLENDAYFYDSALCDSVLKTGDSFQRKKMRLCFGGFADIRLGIIEIIERIK